MKHLLFGAALALSGAIYGQDLPPVPVEAQAPDLRLPKPEKHLNGWQKAAAMTAFTGAAYAFVSAKDPDSGMAPYVAGGLATMGSMTLLIIGDYRSRKPHQ